MKRYRRQQRGVVILMVISLLVLFVTVGLTFAIVAGQYNHSAQTASRVRQLNSVPQRLIELALYQVLRDTPNTNSGIHNLSLLRDMYGDMSIQGKVKTVSLVPAGNSEFMDLELEDLSGAPITPASNGSLGGRVLTMKSGSAKHLSSYTIGWFLVNGIEKLRVVLPQRSDGQFASPQIDDYFIINGRAFDGGSSGPNEPYDAPDGSNSHLANTSLFIPSGPAPNPSRTTSPSFSHSAVPTVDTDGDGILDSVWSDLGLPTQSTRDGRLCQPRFAIQVVDLDKGLNLNSAGMRSSSVLPSTVATFSGPTVVTTADLPAGHGYGPAEIDLIGGLTGIYSSFNSSSLSLRYGRDGAPGLGSASGGIDWECRQRRFEYPVLYSSPTAARPYPRPLSSFGLPPDLFGEISVGVDSFGQPVFGRSLRQYGDDCPGEFSLVRGTDDPFRYSELEYLLRQYDDDAKSLDGKRLRYLAGNNSLRQAVTTHSFDVPAIGVSIVDKNVNRLSPSPPSTSYSFVNRIDGVMNHSSARALFSPETLMGMRMNVNRPFGNGSDDNGNLVVDDPGEAFGPQPMWNPSAGTMYPPGSPIAASQFRENNFQLSMAPSIGRLDFAKHLYCLLLLLCGYGNSPPMMVSPTVSMTGNLPDPAVAAACAQWAVNVVDFRDADSINTQFAYDPNPLDGVWSPTAAVWGVERPELVLGECLSTHDRRSEDRMDDGGTVQGGMDNNNDFDQRLLPSGALFVELLNPWQGKDDVKPPEIYSYANVGGVLQPQGVQLDKVVGASPVWRLLIVEPSTNTIERVVHFANVATALGAPATATVHYSSLAHGAVKALQPGGTAVIGSGIRLSATSNSYVTPFGRKTGEADGALFGAGYTTKRIALDPAANTISVLDNGGAPYSTNTSVVLIDRPSKPIPGAMAPSPTSWPIPLSVSEPTGGYNLTGFDGAAAGGEGAYTVVKSSPLDDSNVQLKTDGPKFNYRQIQLQRLADPTQAYSGSNPYITQDSMSVDLVVFNGVDDSVPEPPNMTPAPARFSSFQRGDQPSGGGTPLFWKIDSVRTAMPMAGNDPTHRFPHLLTHSLGSIGSNYTTFTSFPWLSILNRPFFSQFELLLVPRTTQLGLLQDFSTLSAAAAASHGTEFLHLGPPLKDAGYSANDVSDDMIKIFECLHVPSQYCDADKWANSTHFSKDITSSPAVYGTDFFHPPFNRVPSFREPGRVNVNTVNNASVWNALHLKYTSTRPGPVASPLFVDWAADRGASYANPYQSAHSLLRRSSGVLLFGQDVAPTGATDQWKEVLNTNRNPYFRYQNMVRLGNMVTGRSNVYAIWITVGYFEIDPATGAVVQEAGATTGEIERHRGFYIVDRTIPVAYEAGQNHNVDKMVVLKRFIE